MSFELTKLLTMNNRGAKKRLMGMSAGVAIGVALIFLIWGFFMIFLKPEKKVIPGLRAKAIQLNAELGTLTQKEITASIIVFVCVLIMTLRSFIPILEPLAQFLPVEPPDYAPRGDLAVRISAFFDACHKAHYTRRGDIFAPGGDTLYNFRMF